MIAMRLAALALGLMLAFAADAKSLRPPRWRWIP
jgi:hypothetical protein